MMTPTSNHNGAILSGDDLSELKRYVLELSRKILVENVDAPRFLPYFRSRFILDQRECDQIKSCSRQSRYDGAEKLLDALLTKGGAGYDHFCAAIMFDRTQMYLLTALNKKLEMLRERRKSQVENDQRFHQLEKDRQLRLQAEANRHQQNSIYSHPNRTYPMMTVAYSGLRCAAQPVPPGPAAAGAERLHIPAAPYNHAPDNFVRLARSPIPTPTEEMEPVATPNIYFPHPPQSQEAYCHHQFTDPRLAQQQHVLPQFNEPEHHLQQVNHPPVFQLAPSSQPTHQTQGYNRGYPPHYVLHGHRYDCVPPPAPVEVQYPVLLEGVAYNGHHAQIHYHEVLTLNTPIGAMMENLLPGVPPPPTGSPSADTCAASSQTVTPAGAANDHCRQLDGTACHKLPGTSPPHPPSCGLMSNSTAVTYGGSSKDILCGQSGK